MRVTGRLIVTSGRAGRGARAGALTWLVLTVCAAGCGGSVPDPEEGIRAALAEAEAAAEAGDFAALAERVAHDYADRAGRDRRALGLVLRGLLMRYPRMELLVTVREIEILSPQLARVRLEVISAGAGPAGLSADAFPLALSLRDDGGGWKVTRAEWGGRFGDGI